MKNKIIILVLIIGSVASAVILFKVPNKNIDIDREQVLGQLYLAIEKAKEDGNYKCCIEPPCTMCYMDNWIWEGGICECDEMIAKRDWDKVCPQCVRGIEEGKCESQTGACPAI